MKSLFFLLLINAFALSCVKDEGKVSQGNNVDSTGGSGGGSTGSTGGSPSLGSDPLAAQAWHLENTGQSGYSTSTGTSGEDISVKYVHNTLDILGRNVKIAVSDSGTDITHPDLVGNTLGASLHRNYTFSDSTLWHGASPLPSGDESHGTSVAGLISSVGWNNIGSRGVAPLSKYASFRYIFSYPASETYSSRLARSVDQTYGDFDIFNYSYGYTGYVFVQEDPTLFDAYEIGVNQLRNGKGAIYVQSAGNSYQEAYEICDSDIDPDCLIYSSGNTNAHTDLATPYKIVVGAVNANGVRSSYSSPGSSIWISAPGGEYGITDPAMISTDIQGCNAGSSFLYTPYPTYFNYGGHASNPQCDYTNQFNGTSAAAPVASGVIALLLEANPNLTWRDVKHILAYTADKVDYDVLLNTVDHPFALNPFGISYTYDYKWVLNSAGYLFSNWYGFGRVNAENAVAMAKTYNLSTLGTYEETKNEFDTWYYDSGELTGKSIMDENPSPVSDRIWVGHNFFVESVEIKLSTDHPWPGDLAVHLVSPTGTESRLLTLNNNIYGDGLEPEFTMLSNAFYGESSEGYWTIKVVDGDSYFGTGEIQRWKIKVNGHRLSSNLSKPYPPTFMSFGTTPLTLDRTPVFSFSDSVSHSTLLRYEAAVGTDPYNESIQAWTSIGLVNNGQQFTGLSLVSGTTYYLKIRAVSSSGTSSVQLLSWTTP